MFVILDSGVFKLFKYSLYTYACVVSNEIIVSWFAMSYKYSYAKYNKNEREYETMSIIILSYPKKRKFSKHSVSNVVDMSKFSRLLRRTKFEFLHFLCWRSLWRMNIHEIIFSKSWNNATVIQKFTRISFGYSRIIFHKYLFNNKRLYR